MPAHTVQPQPATQLVTLARKAPAKNLFTQTQTKWHAPGLNTFTAHIHQTVCAYAVVYRYRNPQTAAAHHAKITTHTS